MAPQTCPKILNVAVKVDWVPSCASGTVIATSAADQFCDKHNGPDDWHGWHATAVCDYSKTGFQRIAHTRLPIDEGQLGASGCGSSPKPPNLSLMTSPGYWLPETPTSVPQPLYNYIAHTGFIGAPGTDYVHYAGGCTGDTCSYTIMDQGQWKYTYPACPSGTSPAESLYVKTGGVFSSTYTQLSGQGCYTTQPPVVLGCATGDVAAYTPLSGGGYTSAGCQRLDSTRVPDGYTVTGAVNVLNFTRAGLVKKVTESDAWDNQCAGLEAQAK
jgi:hypothetical protein